MTEIMLTGGMPVTPAPRLLKKGREDEEGLEDTPISCVLEPFDGHKLTSVRWDIYPFIYIMGHSFQTIPSRYSLFMAAGTQKAN